MSSLDLCKAKILFRQHLTAPAEPVRVCKDLNGLQAQFMRNVFHSLKIRCPEGTEPDCQEIRDRLVKSWTLRGTVHVFAKEDLSLFLHQGRDHFLRPMDRMEADEYITLDRKQYFADRILSQIGEGISKREELKKQCFLEGMTDRECESLFNSWGGMIRYLAETGKISYLVQEEKAFQRCPDFDPMEKEAAELELARRYFTFFGPSSVNDAAYYFKAPKSRVRGWMNKLALKEVKTGETYRYEAEDDCEMPADYPEIPDCIFLAGFDQLLLGYQKKESLFLPPEHLRGIFNLSGIVMPGILYQGRVTGRWKEKNHKLEIQMFEQVGEKGKKKILRQAEQCWPDLKQVIWN